MLSLQGEARAVFEDRSLAGRQAVEEIAGIELQSRFGRFYFEYAPAERIAEHGRRRHGVGLWLPSTQL